MVVLLVGVIFSASAADPKHVELTLGEESDVYVVQCLEFKYFKVEVTEPCKDLDIYVSRSEDMGATFYINSKKHL